MPPERYVATFLGAGLTLTTAAAAGVGVPKGVWIVAGIIGVLCLTVAWRLRAGADEAKGRSAGSGVVPVRARRDWTRLGGPLLTLIAAGTLIGLITLVISRIDFGSPRGHAVIVCVDSSVSTRRVRRSYLPDLGSVVRQIAAQRDDFYAADCGVNATGNVNWPVQLKFSTNWGNLALPPSIELQAKAKLIRRDLGTLVKIRSKGTGVPLGEILAVMARQCDQAGGGCALYVFTDAKWADHALKLEDGVSDIERRKYIETYLPQLHGLTGSQVNFVGVGHGTSMGPVHLEEAREIANELIRKAGGEMGAWTTRL